MTDDGRLWPRHVEYKVFSATDHHHKHCLSNHHFIDCGVFVFFIHFSSFLLIFHFLLQGPVDQALHFPLHRLISSVVMVSKSLLLAYTAAFAAAGPVQRRVVAELNEEAFNEAQQRDNTANRFFSNVQIKTADGRCLFVDKLSGDFRANLTPVQVGQCGAKDGEGWDAITAGKHNDQANSTLIVSTLACRFHRCRDGGRVSNPRADRSLLQL